MVLFAVNRAALAATLRESEGSANSCPQELLESCLPREYRRHAKPRRMMPSRATINYGLRCVLSVHLFTGGMLIATGCRLLVAPPELQQMAQAAAHEFDFIVPGDYRLSGTSVFLLAGAAKISAVVAFWFLPAALDVVATLGLVLLFAAVTHVHFLTAQPLVPPAVMAMLALAKLLSSPVLTAPTKRPRKAAKGLN